jgi:hypothetical protein
MPRPTATSARAATTAQIFGSDDPPLVVTLEPVTSRGATVVGAARVVDGPTSRSWVVVIAGVVVSTVASSVADCEYCAATDDRGCCHCGDESP